MYSWQPPHLSGCHLHREGRDAATAVQGHAVWEQPCEHSCQCWRRTCLESGSRNSSGAACQPQAPRSFLCSQCAQKHRQVCTPELAATLQPKAQTAPWQSWKDHSCPFSLLWPPKCSSPLSFNVSFAVGPRQSLLFQKLGKDGKPETQGLTANAVPTLVYQK